MKHRWNRVIIFLLLGRVCFSLSAEIKDTTFTYAQEGPISYYTMGEAELSKGYAMVAFEATIPTTITAISVPLFHQDVYRMGIALYASFEKGKPKDLLYRKDSILIAPSSTIQYTTVEIPPTLVEGKFYVAVSIESTFTPYTLPISLPYAENPDIFVQPPGKQWVGKDGETWLNAGSGTLFPFNICINAFGFAGKEAVAVLSEHSNYLLTDTISFKNLSTEDFVSFEWSFGTGATPSTSQQKSPQVVYRSWSGSKSVTLKAYQRDGTFYIYKKQIEVEKEPSIIVYSNAADSLPAGGEILLAATGGWRYDWKIADPLLKDDFRAKVKLPYPDNPSTVTYQVDATMGRKKVSKLFPIKIFIIPYDNMKKGKELKCDTLYTLLSNRSATVESSEPQPPIGSSAEGCYRQDRWCPGTSIKNTIWFSFIAPDARAVKIETKGFDNRIALYRSDAVSPSYADLYLMAANDDFKDSFEATIEFAETTPDQRYWIQLDGANGKVSDSISVFIHPIQKIPYDWRSDALKLRTDSLYTALDNRFSTIEEDEPTPQDWISPIEHTLWFSFVSPSSGLVSVKTEKAPIRMALYHLDNNGNLSLVCHSDEAYSDPCILSKVVLDKTGTYLVQMDAGRNRSDKITLQLNSNPISETMELIWKKESKELQIISQEKIRHIRWYDLSGRLLGSLNGGLATDLYIPMSQLIGGLYLLERIDEKNQSKMEKFFVW